MSTLIWAFPLFDKEGKCWHPPEYKVLPVQDNTGTVLAVGLSRLKAKHKSSDAQLEEEKVQYRPSVLLYGRHKIKSWCVA